MEIKRKQILYDMDIFGQCLAFIFSFRWPIARMMLFAKMFVIYFIIYCAECIIELSLNTVLTQIENSLIKGVNSAFLIAPSSKLIEVLFCEQLFFFLKSINYCN